MNDAEPLLHQRDATCRLAEKQEARASARGLSGESARESCDLDSESTKRAVKTLFCEKRENFSQKSRESGKPGSRRWRRKPGGIMMCYSCHTPAGRFPAATLSSSLRRSAPLSTSKSAPLRLLRLLQTTGAPLRRHSLLFSVLSRRSDLRTTSLIKPTSD